MPVRRETVVNRTKRCEQLWAPAGDEADVFVPAQWSHPTRGRVVCLAAPLLVATLRARGLAVSTSNWSSTVSAHRRSGDSRAHALSYQDPRGGPAAGLLAVAANPESAREAEAAVAQWAAVVRTRRVLLEPQRAEPGAGPDGGSQSKCRDGVTDCGSWARAQGCIEAYARRGDTVVVLGSRTTSMAEAVVSAAVPSAVRRLNPPDRNRVSFVLQPGHPVEDGMRILQELRQEYPRLRGQHPDQWCYRSWDQRETRRALVAHADCVLVLGRPGDRESCAATADAVLGGHLATWITSLSDLTPAAVGVGSTVAVVATDSGRSLRTPVLRCLAGLGPLSIVERQMSSTVVPLPEP